MANAVAFDSSTYGDRVLEYVREQILSGHYLPGQRISEVELAEALGISRSPIREAFRRLATEGLLRIAPYKGVTVATFDETTVRELFELREAVEGMAAGLAAQRADPEQLDEMERLLEATRRSLDDREGSGYPHDHDYHRLIVAMSGNKMLEQKALEINAQVVLARSLSGSYGDRATHALEEHVALFQAIKERNAELAEQCMRRHIRLSLQHTLEILDAIVDEDD